MQSSGGGGSARDLCARTYSLPPSPDLCDLGSPRGSPESVGGCFSRHQNPTQPSIPAGYPRARLAGLLSINWRQSDQDKLRLWVTVCAWHTKRLEDSPGWMPTRSGTETAGRFRSVPCVWMRGAASPRASCMEIRDCLPAFWGESRGGQKVINLELLDSPWRVQ